MSANTQRSRQGSFARKLLSTGLLVAGAFGTGATGSTAQEAIGVPFIGRNHLSFYTTELSRDGVGTERAALFGGTYGRTFGERNEGVQISVITRVGARAFGDLESGILDAAATVAATKAVPGLEKLSFSAAAEIGTMIWGQGSNGSAQDSGRLSARVPFKAGAAYDLRAGRATITPFAWVTTAYARDTDYVNDRRVARESDWRVGYARGVAVRFDEIVMSLTDVSREPGLPHDHRLVFNVGMSW